MISTYYYFTNSYLANVRMIILFKGTEGFKNEESQIASFVFPLGFGSSSDWQQQPLSSLRRLQCWRLEERKKKLPLSSGAGKKKKCEEGEREREWGVREEGWCMEGIGHVGWERKHGRKNKREEFLKIS